MKTAVTIGMTLATIFVLTTSAAYSQEPKNPRSLGGYAQAKKQVTELDWRLLQFNLSWHESYSDGEYVKSSPLWFDYKTMTFQAWLRVAEKRDYSDPEPFFSLPTDRRRAILQGVVDHMTKLLSNNFPGIADIQQYVQVTFVYMESSGGSSTVASYARGRLTLQDR